MTNTSNMSLMVPTIGTDSGLTWEQAFNANAYTLDGHNHSPGYGAQITPAGININSSLAFNNQQATGLQLVQLQTQSSSTVLQSMYSSGGELYYNDAAGNVVKLTSGGTVNATSSGISSGTATASFVSSVLVVNAAVNTPANIQGGSILLGNNTLNSKFLTLSPPSAMAANFTLTLPSVPAVQSFMTVDTSGGISPYASINQGITRSNLASVGQQISPSSSTFTTAAGFFTDVTGVAVTITTSGRPVMIFTQHDGNTTFLNASGYLIQNSNNAGGQTSCAGYIGLARGGAMISSVRLENVGGPQPTALTALGLCAPPGVLMILDTPAAGTYTYQLQICLVAGTAFAARYMKLVAYEL